jgi:Na+/H+-dicarboxylate symporter
MEFFTKFLSIRRFFTPNFLMLWGVLLGALSGYIHYSPLHKTAEIISALMTDSLKLLSTPIIFVSVVATISGMRSFNEMRTLGLKVFKYTLITTLLAASVALVFFLILNPVQQVMSASLIQSDASSPNYLDALLKMYPSNIVTAFHENNVIGIVLVAVFLGVSILLIPQENKQTLNHLFMSLFTALVKMTQILIRILPIGIWAFVSLFVVEIREGNTASLSSLLRYVLCVFGSTLFQGIVVLPLLLKFKGISPLKTAKGMFSAISVAFFSKSSNATLPLTMKCAQENLKISPRVATFSLPLCTTINMNGCAAFILNTVLFVAMSYGMNFSLFDMIMWVFVATLAAIGNAGIPMGCYFLASAFLAAMNVPLDIMGLILPIYTLMDMVETSVNVWSDGCVTAIVDKEMQFEQSVLQQVKC